MKRLQDFRRLIDHAEFLRIIINITPFALLFSNDVKEVLVNIQGFEWDTWSETVRKFPDLANKKLFEFCILESESSLNTSADQKFWWEMAKTFQ